MNLSVKFARLGMGSKKLVKPAAGGSELEEVFSDCESLGNVNWTRGLTASLVAGLYIEY